MKLKISPYIHYVSNLHIAAEIPQQDYYYHLRPIEYRITKYKLHYDNDLIDNDTIKCFPIYENTSILLTSWPNIVVI